MTGLFISTYTNKILSHEVYNKCSLEIQENQPENHQVLINESINNRDDKCRQNNRDDEQKQNQEQEDNEVANRHDQMRKEIENRF